MTTTPDKIDAAKFDLVEYKKAQQAIERRMAPEQKQKPAAPKQTKVGLG